MQFSKVIQETGVEIVNVEELKEYLVVEHNRFDLLIQNLGIAARQLLESYTDLDLKGKIREIYLDQFQNTLKIEYGNITSLNSIKYNDSDGNQQTMAEEDYTLDDVVIPAEIIFHKRPNTDRTRNNVIINYTSSTAPQLAKQAIKLIVGEWYEERSNSTPVNLKEIPLGLTTIANGLRQYII